MERGKAAFPDCKLSSLILPYNFDLILQLSETISSYPITVRKGLHPPLCLENNNLVQMH